MNYTGFNLEEQFRNIEYSEHSYYLQCIEQALFDSLKLLHNPDKLDICSIELQIDALFTFLCILKYFFQFSIALPSPHIYHFIVPFELVN